MKNRCSYFLVILFLFIITGCDEPITGIVVDAETGQQIEGAVILVEWTRQIGVGLTYTKSHKVIEVVTDKDGKASIEGVFSPFVDPPDVTVYKMGYVAWNNYYIFPDYKKRTDFKWENNYIFKLQKFVPEYSHDKHTDFINYSIHVGAAEKKRLMLNAIRWEQLRAYEERSKNTR